MHVVTQHSSSWRWWVSFLLLLATMINYMDRQTLANLSVRITNQFELTEEQYGELESTFGVAFAFGALTFGAIADRVSVRILYPFVLVAWSTMGFLTGLTHGYDSMLRCRMLLGFFEAGHWPCALIVMQTIMNRGDRVMGNSILQSGASLGAILTPLVIRAMVGNSHEPDVWRPPFLVIGAVGILWAVVWLCIIKKGDLVPAPKEAKTESEFPFSWLVEFLSNPKFWALVVMVICNNTAWQLIRAWLPKFLQTGRGYTESEALYFNSVYYIFTDIGCITAGWAAMWLIRRGSPVHNARVIVYAFCAVLTALTVAAGNMEKGWPLLAVLLLIAAGSLGLFPCYYSFTQELTTKHLGKASGCLGFIGWIVSSPLQRQFGRVVDMTHSYNLSISLVGLAPLIGLFAMLLLWRDSGHDSQGAPSKSP